MNRKLRSHQLAVPVARLIRGAMIFGGFALCLWLLSFSDLTAFAQKISQPANPETSELSKKFLKTTWATEDGLPSNSINSIIQTRDGYLWMATSGGLLRFDGIKFTVFTQLNTPGLKSNRIRKLLEDASGALWIATDDSGVARSSQVVFRHWTTRDGLPGDRVEALASAGDGGVWIGTTTGLAKFRDGHVETIETPLRSAVWAIYEDARSSLWLGTQNGLLRYAGGRFTVFTTKDGLPQDRVEALCETRDGKLWIGTDDIVSGGLAYYQNGAITPFKLPFKLSQGIHSFLEDRQGALWIGLWGEGVIHMLGERVTRLTSRDGFSRSGILEVFEDREGNFWFGSSDGLIRWRRKQVATLTSADGLAAKAIFPMREDSRGAVWIGSSCEGISRMLNGPNEKLTHWSVERDLNGGCVHAIGEDAAGNIWICTTKGLAQLEGDRFVFRIPGEPPNMCVHALYRDASGSFWIGEDSGLHRLNPVNSPNGILTTWRVKDGLVQNEGIKFITLDKEGALLSLSTPSDHERAIGQIKEISEASSSALLEIRELASNLHPYLIDQFDLASALETMAARIADSSEIKFSHQIDAINGELSKEAQINLYRIVQESLNNIVTPDVFPNTTSIEPLGRKFQVSGIRFRVSGYSPAA